MKTCNYSTKFPYIYLPTLRASTQDITSRIFNIKIFILILKISSFFIFIHQVLTRKLHLEKKKNLFLRQKSAVDPKIILL